MSIHRSDADQNTNFQVLHTSKAPLSELRKSKLISLIKHLQNN